MSQTYYTQTITSDGSGLALSDATQASAPYITYNCKSPVNLNFLFREVLFCDPESVSVNPDDALTGSSKVHIVPTYQDQATAEAIPALDRYADVSSTHGHFYAMRLINALMRNELQLDPAEQANLDAYVKHYGGYEDGLISGTAVNSSLASTATMDFGEFFQVALSAVRNKETDAITTSTKGLVDRENINNAAVVDDLKSRTVTNVAASDLLETMLLSSRQSNTFANGLIDNSSSVNWMKQILYSIIIQSAANNGSVTETEGDERYTPIKRTGVANNEQERFMQLKLKDGDFIVIVFQFTVSKDDGTIILNDRPDEAGVPMTIGFKIEHSDAAGDYETAGTGTGGILPIGWENSNESVQAPASVTSTIDPFSREVDVQFEHPAGDVSDLVRFTVQVTDTQANVIKTKTVPYDPAVFGTLVGPVSPGTHDIIVSVTAKYDIGGTTISSDPVVETIQSLDVPAITQGAASFRANRNFDLEATPANVGIFSNRYRVQIEHDGSGGVVREAVLSQSGLTSPVNLIQYSGQFSSSFLAVNGTIGSVYSFHIAPQYFVDGVYYDGPFTTFTATMPAFSGGNLTSLTTDPNKTGDINITHLAPPATDLLLLSSYELVWEEALGTSGTQFLGTTVPPSLAYSNFTLLGGFYSIKIRVNYNIGGVITSLESNPFGFTQISNPASGPSFNWSNASFNRDLIISSIGGVPAGATVYSNINGEIKTSGGGDIIYYDMNNMQNYTIDLWYQIGILSSPISQKNGYVEAIGSYSG